MWRRGLANLVEHRDGRVRRKHLGELGTVWERGIVSRVLVVVGVDVAFFREQSLGAGGQSSETTQDRDRTDLPRSPAVPAPVFGLSISSHMTALRRSPRARC